MLLITEQNDQLNYLTEEDENGKRTFSLKVLYARTEEQKR